MTRQNHTLLSALLGVVMGLSGGCGGGDASESEALTVSAVASAHLEGSSCEGNFVAVDVKTRPGASVTVGETTLTANSHGRIEQLKLPFSAFPGVGRHELTVLVEEGGESVSTTVSFERAALPMILKPFGEKEALSRDSNPYRFTGLGGGRPWSVTRGRRKPSRYSEGNIKLGDDGVFRAAFEVCHPKTVTSTVGTVEGITSKGFEVVIPALETLMAVPGVLDPERVVLSVSVENIDGERGEAVFRGPLPGAWKLLRDHFGAARSGGIEGAPPYVAGEPAPTAVVALSESQGGRWAMRFLGGGPPRAVRLVAVVEELPPEPRGSCGPYSEYSYGVGRRVSLHFVDKQVKVYEAATGKLLGEERVAAKRSCPYSVTAEQTSVRAYASSGLVTAWLSEAFPHEP